MTAKCWGLAKPIEPCSSLLCGLRRVSESDHEMITGPAAAATTVTDTVAAPAPAAGTATETPETESKGLPSVASAEKQKSR